MLPYLLAHFIISESHALIPQRRTIRPWFQASPKGFVRRLSPLSSSLFDDDNDGPITKETSTSTTDRKFTGQVDGRNRIRQQEYSLVTRATSTGSFAGLATLILAMAVLFGYVGVTGQLGLNNNFDDDDTWNYEIVEPTTRDADGANPLGQKSTWI